MSTLKADAVTTKSDNTDLTITGGGTGVPNLETGFKVGGTVGVPISGLQVGTDGELITWDASGDPAAVAVGTATHVLTSNGAGAAPTFQAAAAGGAWTLIATAVASDSASLTITGLDTTYASYRFQCNDIVAASAGAMLEMRIGDSGGIDSGGSDYAYHMQKCNSDSTAYTSSKAPSADSIKILDAVNSNTYGGAVSGTITQGFDGTNECNISGYGNCRSTGAEQTGGVLMGGRKAVITVTQVQVFMSTGNITSGRFTVWGVKHS